MKIETGLHKGQRGDNVWKLDDPLGAQRSKYWVRFKNPFPVPPKVTLGLYKFDFVRHANQRIEARVTLATKDGFEITYQKWSATQVWFGGVYWTAFEVADSILEVPNDQPINPQEINGCDMNSGCSPE